MHPTELKVRSGFQAHFRGSPLMVFSPGRVNLIGEHTDYNMGFVLPAAIDKAIYMAMVPNGKNMIRLHSTDMQPSYYETVVASSYQKTGVDWADYVIGVVDQLQKAGYVISGFDCAFGGDTPIGAGLSSSAALEGGIAYGLSELNRLGLSRLEMTKISQKAENQFVGVNCGIMDQFASLHGKGGKVLKLDCRSLDYELVPFEWDNVRVLLCDTKVRRTLAGSEYNVRRSQCETGVAVISKTFPEVKSLRDVTSGMLEAHKTRLDEAVYRRCRYVIDENQRVTDACAALVNNDLAAFGKLMYASHAGLRDQYEVSCEELDVLVEATEKLDGVMGSRMMGGGFGGCTINLVSLEKLDESVAAIRNHYVARFGKEPGFHVVKIGEGTHLMPA
jgi:galactokinase